jgi:hypothetical protein
VLNRKFMDPASPALAASVLGPLDLLRAVERRPAARELLKDACLGLLRCLNRRRVLPDGSFSLTYAKGVEAFGETGWRRYGPEIFEEVDSSYSADKHLPKTYRVTPLGWAIYATLNAVPLKGDSMRLQPFLTPSSVAAIARRLGVDSAWTERDGRRTERDVGAFRGGEPIEYTRHWWQAERLEARLRQPRFYGLWQDLPRDLRAEFYAGHFMLDFSASQPRILAQLAGLQGLPFLRHFVDDTEFYRLVVGGDLVSMSLTSELDEVMLSDLFRQVGKAATTPLFFGSGLQTALRKGQEVIREWFRDDSLRGDPINLALKSLAADTVTAISRVLRRHRPTLEFFGGYRAALTLAECIRAGRPYQYHEVRDTNGVINPDKLAKAAGRTAVAHILQSEEEKCFRAAMGWHSTMGNRVLLPLHDGWILDHRGFDEQFVPLIQEFIRRETRLGVVLVCDRVGSTSPPGRAGVPSGGRSG